MKGAPAKSSPVFGIGKANYRKSIVSCKGRGSTNLRCGKTERPEDSVDGGVKEKDRRPEHTSVR